MKDKGENYEVSDRNNSCGDIDCCGSDDPLYCVYLPVRGWDGWFSDIEKAERMARLCKRWGVK